ncbi:hypothetical protein [Leptospira adleri]|uniref:HEPN domain-containing protein n=1 Tax=Leptospira adleri TaxID=2023186 RepID=A0ABX4NSN3_9LEPT|nr:hypothetical protein [Leptospira adleri]PJZ59685.1 hypothetical protein CH376_22455 [Leptospira adleri]
MASELDILSRNPNKLANLLSLVLDNTEQKKILAVSEKHTKLLMKLSKHHLQFAKKISKPMDWRQKISRSYYSCYNASKAIRLITKGEYSQEASDHKKIGELPNDFPQESVWSNFLNQMRADRNLSDYDHEKICSDLTHTPREYITQTESFYKEVKKYLASRGIVCS